MGKRSRRAKRRPKWMSARLTPRQHDVLILIARGMSEPQIARRWRRSPQTIHAHAEAVRRAFGAHSRVQLVVRALAAGTIRLKEVVT